MSVKFIGIGFGNMVAADRVVMIASPDSSPIKRMIQDAKDNGRAIDVSCGRKTRSVLITDTDHVILSAFQTETLAARLESGDSGASDDTPDADETKETEKQEK